MIGIDKYAYMSNIADVKTEVKLCFAGLPLIICLFCSNNIISIFTIIAMFIASIYFGGFKIKTFLKMLLVPSMFLITGVITIIFSQVDYNSGNILFAIELFGNYYGINFESLNNGLILLLKALATFSCLCFFSLNTPINYLLSYLRKIKFAKIIIELMELIYRFIFVLWEEANKIYIAQTSRLGYKGFKNSINSLGELVTSVFIRALIRVERVNVSMEARGFDGDFDYMIEDERNCKQLNVCTILLTVLLISTKYLIQ